MAKLRRHHTKSGGRGGVFSVRLVIVFLLIGAMIAATIYLSNSDLFQAQEISTASIDYATLEDRFFLPTTKDGQIIHHKYYSLSYNEDAEQAEWVAYYLSKASLQKKNVARAKRFESDPSVTTKSATHGDYIRSGYDRGHLVPAADMAFDKIAMEETFYMSNISPQIRQFNGAVWRELEETVRDWAYRYGGLYVVSGPVFGESKKRIGKSKVLVPEGFYKVLLDLESKDQKGVAFLIPNKVSFEPLSTYAMPIDHLEKITGFDFYSQLIEDEIEEEIESNVQIDKWPFSKKRFDLRNTKWNRVQ